MDRRSFCETALIACAGAFGAANVCAAEPWSSPTRRASYPKGLWTKRRMPRAEFETTARAVCHEFPEVAEGEIVSLISLEWKKVEPVGRFYLFANSNVAYPDHVCKLHTWDAHQGMELDGIWSALNYYRTEMEHHIVEWERLLNTWHIPGPIWKWRWNRERPSVAEPCPTNSGDGSWGYGLWLGVRKILEASPFETRMRWANTHARSVGYGDIHGVINHLVASNHHWGFSACDRKQLLDGWYRQFYVPEAMPALA